MAELTSSRLPVPTLDDRRFQDLVDAARRLVQARCPEWTGFLPGDPGVAIIEAAAYLVDTLLYRLNQVPDVMYSRFLDLLAVGRLPATVARTDVDFYFAAVLDRAFTLPRRTEVATVEHDDGERVVFSTLDPVTVMPIGDVIEVRSPGDRVEIGFAQPASEGSIVLLSVEVTRGRIVEPQDVEWEYATANGWRTCDLVTDETAGLTSSGQVLLAFGAGHASAGMDDHADSTVAAWVRTTQPVVGAAVRSAGVVGVRVATENFSRVETELGVSDGRARQTVALPRSALVGTEAHVMVDNASWAVVPSLLDSRADAEHVEFDAENGIVRFGDGIHGRVPAAGATIAATYRHGDGAAGNVAAHSLAVLLEAVPLVARIDNPRSAFGGTDPEPVEQARARAPELLRSSGRAVTVDDFEALVRSMVPSIARVRCLGPGGDRAPVQVLLVPFLPAEPSDLEFVHLVLDEPVLQPVIELLDERRLVGTSVSVGAPKYSGVSVQVELVVDGRDRDVVARDARAAISTYLHPLVGGQDRSGWPFGRALVAGELFGPLLAVAGVELVEKLVLVPIDPITTGRGVPTDRIDLGPDTLLFACEHDVICR